MKKHLIYFSILVFFISSCSSRLRDGDFHGDNINSVEITKKIEKGESIYIENAIITGDIDFTSLDIAVQENKNMKMVYIDQSICFVNCTFNGKIISSAERDGAFLRTCFYKSVVFSNCIFKDELIFRESSFYGLFDISNSVIDAVVDFTNSDFHFKNTYFNDISFNGDVYFVHTRFNSNTNFSNTFFKQNLFFQNAIFAGNTNFSSCSFGNYNDFSGSRFNGINIFNYSKFRGRTFFNNVKINDRTEFSKVEFKDKLEFKSSESYSNISFNDAVFEGDIDFTDAFFLILPETKNIKKKKGVKFVYSENKKITNFGLSENYWIFSEF